MLQGVSTVGRLSRSWLRSLGQPANPSRAHPRGDAEVERLATCHTDRIMTFEEGLERLKERHEALTQSVELMVAENRERDKRLGEIMEGIARLLHVAEIQE